MTKLNSKVKFKKKTIKEDLFNITYFFIYVNNEQAGFAKIRYISEENSLKKLNTIEDYFINVVNYDNSVYKKLLASDKEQLYQMLFGKTEQESISYLKEIYTEKHQSFINYWVNKPSIEMIRIYDSEDKDETHIEHGNIVKINRIANLNWKNNGLAKKLYKHIQKELNKDELTLWKSNKTNEISNKIWKSLPTESINNREFLVSLPKLKLYNS